MSKKGIPKNRTSERRSKNRCEFLFVPALVLITRSREAERERLYAHTSTTHNLHAHVHDDRMSKPEENEQGRRPVGEQSDLRPLAEDLSFFLEPVQESSHLLARVSRSVLTGLRVLLNTDFAASLHTQFGSKEGEQGAGAEEIMNGDGNPEEQGADSPRVWELSLGTLLGFSQLSDDEIETLYVMSLISVIFAGSSQLSLTAAMGLKTRGEGTRRDGQRRKGAILLPSVLTTQAPAGCVRRTRSCGEDGPHGREEMGHEPRGGCLHRVMGRRGRF